MRVQYRWLNLMLAACVVAAAAGLFLLSGTPDFGVQAGQWLLTVVVAFADTGALSLVVRQIDQRRSVSHVAPGCLAACCRPSTHGT